MTNEPAYRIYNNVTTTNHLNEIYSKYVQHSSARGRDGVDPENLADDIDQICDLTSARMRTGRYTFTQYRQLLLSKGAEKYPRIISIPTARDRIVLRALADLLGGVYPAARGVIPQVRVSDVSEAVSANKYDSFVRLDIRDFYPSISHHVILRSISRKIRKRAIIDLIMLAVKTPTVADGAKKRQQANLGIPQGLAISNILAELVVKSVDSKMIADHRCAYFRFVDDVLILCDRGDAATIYGQIQVLFANLGLTVHPLTPGSGKSVSGNVAKGFEYLGYVFTPERISVRPSSIHRVETALARSFTKYKKSSKLAPERNAISLERCKWQLNLTITGCIYKGTARGWLHYFSQMNDFTLLKRLDATVLRLRRRFNFPTDIQIKTFMRSYWAIQRPHGDHLGYVPNFDMKSVSEMRSTLYTGFGVENAYELPPARAIRMYHALVNKAVSELDRDIGTIS